MRTHLLRLGMACGLLAGLGIGCSSEKQVESGLLDDHYAMMKPVDNDPKYRAYVNKTLLQQYDKFMVDPVQVHIAPDAPGPALTPRTCSKSRITCTTRSSSRDRSTCSMSSSPARAWPASGRRSPG